MYALLFCTSGASYFGRLLHLQLSIYNPEYLTNSSWNNLPVYPPGFVREIKSNKCCSNFLTTRAGVKDLNYTPRCAPTSPRLSLWPYTLIHTVYSFTLSTPLLVGACPYDTSVGVKPSTLYRRNITIVRWLADNEPWLTCKYTSYNDRPSLSQNIISTERSSPRSTRRIQTDPVVSMWLVLNLNIYQKIEVTIHGTVYRSVLVQSSEHSISFFLF